MRNPLPLSGRSFLLTAALLGGISAFADELTINDGTTASNYSPVYTYYWSKANKSQILIPATDITELQGKTITAIKFYAKTVNNSADYKLKINAGYSESDVFQTASFYESDTFTNVFDGDVSFMTTTSGREWEIVFTTPLNYTGSNLVFEFVNEKGTGIQSYFYGKTASAYYTLYSRNGSTAIGYSFSPKMTFTYTSGNVSVSSSAVSSSKVDFGSAAAGKETKEEIITITNTGNTDLSGSISLDDNTNFSISHEAVPTMAQGGTLALTVSYKPSAAGSHSANVTIDLGASGKHTVALSGNAYEKPDGEAFVFDEEGYDTKLPLVLTGFATEYYTYDGTLSDFTTDYDYFPTTYRFESKTYYGSGCIAWNHANPMAGADTSNDVTFNRYYYLVTPAVNTGKLWLRALTTDVSAVGCYVKAYEATPMDDGSFTLSDTDLAITWDADLNQNAWSCGTLSCTKDARIAIMMKYAALNSIIIVEEGTGTALPSIAALPQSSLSGRYILSDISGKVVARGVIANESQLSAVTAGLQPGVYIIKTATGTKKIMKR